jgi:predicted ATPase
VWQPPSGIVTFLFTDIEGSTRLWEQRPDDMRSLVAEHDERVRAAIERHGGYVFATGGDGFAAAFGRAADAVAAAAECQATLADLLDIKVRIGINTGEAHERGGDYFGPPVNRTARLMAAGHGDQVLLSGVTAELVPNLSLQNLGEHRLRDLASPMIVWQLGTDDFPPLRTLGETSGNLPVQRTSFIGRVDEAKHLAALVGAERLVTLTGVGGVGKTRLALQVAAEVAPNFEGGAWFVSLAALEEGALVAAAVLESLGVPERQGESALDTLCAWASTREALVLIDNCEHLLADVAAVVDGMLDASATVTVLATSQALLGVRGERAWAVAPLSGADGSSRDSVELFVERARMTRPDFVLTDENEPAVIEICERLHHVPLALELAAARVRGMAPSDIARRLDQRLRLFTSSDRLAPGRHRTLDAAVRWSYELLDDAQQRVFDRLSVFAGRFTIEAAQGIVAGDGVDEWDVVDGILALVDKSLVVADEVAGGARYRLLETLRQFGHADLTDAGTLELYRDRHADFYAEYVLSRRPRLHGGDAVAALHEIERELDNLRVALRYAAEDHTSSRFEVLFSLLYVLWTRGRNSEGASWATQLTKRRVDPAARIVALGMAANVLINISLEEAEVLAHAAIDLAAATAAAPPLQAIVAKNISAMMQGNNEAAVAGCDQVIAWAAAEPDLFERCNALTACYRVFGICGVLDRLDDLERDITTLVKQLDNRWLEASSASAFASMIHVTDPDRAGEYLLRAYELSDELGSRGANLHNALFLALNALRAGDSVGAARWATRSLRSARDFGPSYIAQVTDVVVAIVRRHSPEASAVLLGALRAHRDRKREAGTQREIDAEARQEASLRRALGADFDRMYARGLGLDEASMITLAFTQLDAIAPMESSH